MLKKIFLLFVTLFLFPVVANASLQSHSIDDPIKIKDPYMDLKSFAYYVAEKQKWSLIICNDAYVPVKKINGDTIKDILENYCKNSEIGWHFENNCLYIAKNNALNAYFKQLPFFETRLPDGNKSATYTGCFKNVDFSVLCNTLSSISGTKIRLTNNLDANIMMRVNGMPWKRVLLAVVLLNKYNINISDFSMIISPAKS